MSGSPLVWINGEIFDAANASVSALDHGFTLGDGFFESVRVTDRNPRFLERHFVRMRQSADRLDIALEPSATVLRDAIDVLIARFGSDSARLRLSVTSGSGPLGPLRGTSSPTITIAIDTLPEFSPTVRIVTVPWIRNERSPLAGIKSASWGEGVEMLRLVRQMGADEALLADSTGRLSEAIAANVFLVLDGELVTPSLATGCLPGVARSVLLDAGLARECDVDINAIARADEIFLGSSISGIRPVVSIDGTSVSIASGSHTLAARKLLEAQSERTDK
ncbi:IlvE Branched-chain amino acid aminotransferase/4-amino-4-deoxychorismate lyase [Acidimicrobiia bacterium]